MTGDSSTPSDALKHDHVDRNPIDVLAEDFLARRRQGDNPSISHYARRHPELANEIETLFPTLAMLEEAGVREAFDTDSQSSGLAFDIPDQLGEYRIIREIGRGGMGVVFEAEHVTMRRRVALKILPPEAGLNSRNLERFHREVRSAGRLHHTNIVPVFEVGVQNGLHYYGMQYINGQSLDKVIEELRLMRDQTHASEGSTLADDASGSTADLVMTSDEQSLAMSLHTGDSVRAVVGAGEEPTRGSAASEKLAESDSRPSWSSGRVYVSERDDLSSGAAGSRGRSRETYSKRIARLGLQVADALSCAHEHGILHRDIKPANLILDTSGTVWVTDFGLAKTEDDRLTESGDFVGTLRYMSPERVSGRDPDQRADIYGLGLTLYELATLQPAFSETDRARLLQRVTNEEPERPRKLDPKLSRDLETIILKSIEKHPARRYQTAASMAEDLQFFLSDRPVTARRITGGERVWRWAKRNPYKAAVPALLFMLVVGAVIGSLLHLQSVKSASRLLAGTELQTRRTLFRSQVDKSQAISRTGTIGQRLASMQAVDDATTLLPSLQLSDDQMTAERITLRNQLISSLAYDDFARSATPIAGISDGWRVRAVDRRYQRYAQSDGRGNIRVCRVDNGNEVASLPGPGMTAWIVRLSHDGRYLSAKYHPRATFAGQQFLVWDVDNEEPMIQWNQARGDAGSAFAPSGSEIIVANGRGRLVRYDCDRRALVGAISVDLPRGLPNQIRYAPDGTRVAFAGQQQVVIASTDGTIEHELPVEATSLCWSATGSLLAAGGKSDGQIHLWDTTSWSHRSFPGHESRVTRIEFNDAQDRLLTASWDRTTRLWDVDSGTEMIRLDGYDIPRLRFGPGEQIWLRDNKNQTVNLRLVKSCVTWLNSAAVRHLAYSPVDPELMVLATADGAELRRGVTGRHVAKLATGSCYEAKFADDGKFVYTCGDEGVARWTIRDGPDPDVEVIVADRKIIFDERVDRFDLSRDGSTIALRLDKNRLLLKTAQSSAWMELDHELANNVCLTPDGQWLVSTTFTGQGVKLWDALTGQLVRDLLPEVSFSRAAFSGDGRWLAVNTANQGSYLWEVGHWEHPRRFGQLGRDDPGAVAFSSDSSILASGSDLRSVQWRDPASGDAFAEIHAANVSRVVQMAFNADGGRFTVITGGEAKTWNLQQVRNQLTDVGLDW